MHASKGKIQGEMIQFRRRLHQRGGEEGSALVTVPQGGGRVPDGVLLNLVVVTRVFALQVFTELLSLPVWQTWIKCLVNKHGLPVYLWC